MPPTHIALAKEVEEFRQQFEQISQDAAALVKTITLRLGDRWTVSNTAGSIAEADGIAAHFPRLVKPFRNSDLAASLAELGPARVERQ